MFDAFAKIPEGQRRLQAADDRIAEHIEGQDQVLPVNGGELMR